MRSDATTNCPGDDAALVRRTLPAVDPFMHWPAAQIEALCKATRVLHAQRGHVLIAQKQQINGIYVISAGVIEVGSTNDDGRRYVRRFAQPGTLFGLISVLDGKGSPYSYAAHESATMLFIPKVAFLSILARHPDMWEGIARFVASFQREALNAIDENMFVPLSNRLARTLVSLSKAYGTSEGQGGKESRICITQYNVASLLGVSRQSVSKEINSLAKRGLVRIEYGAITLIDIAAIDRAGVGVARVSRTD